MKIQANPSGTRSIEVTEKHLETIDKYALLRNLIDSNGIIDEAVLDKLGSMSADCSKARQARTVISSTSASMCSTTTI